GPDVAQGDRELRARRRQRHPILPLLELGLDDRERSDVLEDGVRSIAPGVGERNVDIEEEEGDRTLAFDMPGRRPLEPPVDMDRETAGPEHLDRHRGRESDQEIEWRELEQGVEAQVALDREIVEPEEELDRRVGR